MGVYQVDLDGVARLLREVSHVTDDVEASITRAAHAIDDLTALLAPAPQVQAAFHELAEPRRATGRHLVTHSRNTLDAARRGTLAFVQADEDMAQTTNSSHTRTSSMTADFSWKRFSSGSP